MTITSPINFPSGDRRTIHVAASTPTPGAVLDPLFDASRVRPYTALPLDIAVRLARQTLEKHASESIHDHTAMVCAAVELDGILRDVLDALAAEGVAA